MGAASCDLCAHYVYDEEDDFLAFLPQNQKKDIQDNHHNHF